MLPPDKDFLESRNHRLAALYSVFVSFSIHTHKVPVSDTEGSSDTAILCGERAVESGGLSVVGRSCLPHHSLLGLSHELLRPLFEFVPALRRRK